MQSQRKQLRAMDTAQMPAGLEARLRVAASYDRERRLLRASLRMRIERWYAGFKLFADNLMRPLAVPFAGGVTSAVVCFTLLISLLNFPHDFRDTSFFTAPHGMVVAQGPNGMFQSGNVRIEPVEAADPDNANIVELTIDESGKVSDWSVLRGKMSTDMEELIMFSKFSPAMYLGLPTWGKVKAVQSIPSRAMRS
jgi:hypothetical protein